MCINNIEKGGAEKQFLYIYHFLKKHYEVNIILVNNKGIQNLDSKIKKMIKVGPVGFFTFLFTRKPNVVLFFLPKTYILFGFISIFFPKIKKIMFRRSLNYYQSNFFIKHVEFFLHKFTHLICSNSFAAKKELIKYEKVPKNKVFILKNFIDRKNYKRANKLKIDKKYLNFLCIANFINYKGHDLILEVFKNLNIHQSWRIYFLGKKNEFDFTKIKSLARKYQFEQNVFHINQLSSNLKYPNFYFGLLFSKNESFPNAVMEYLKLNLDVIAYNTGDIKKLMKDGGLIFNTRNPRKITKKIENYVLKKRNKNKTIELNKLINPYQNEKLFLILKKKIDSLCVD